MSYQKIAVAAKSRYAARLVINQMQATLLDLRHDGEVILHCDRSSENNI